LQQVLFRLSLRRSDDLAPKISPYGIPEHEWQLVLARVANHESYRTIAKDYHVSRETIRRLVQASKQAG
jgi:DNA invertase Pin-like site-specific DNA recombinase